MELTEEQRERIRKNRERALEIQRTKRKQREEEENKKLEKEKAEKEENISNKKQKTNSTNSNDSGVKELEQIEGPLEDFEVGASPYVTKKDAASIYCLPEGTLAVCKYEERENPHHKGWKPMKLYYRKEIRERAHKRFDGLDGLVAERRKRQMKKLEKDMKQADSIFN